MQAVFVATQGDSQQPAGKVAASAEKALDPAHIESTRLLSAGSRNQRALWQHIWSTPAVPFPMSHPLQPDLWVVKR